MRRLALPTLLIASALAGPAAGQPTYDFRPRVKAGDAFTASFRRAEKLESEPAGLMSGTHQQTIEVERTILEARDGRPVRFEERTTRHEDKMAARVASFPIDEAKERMRGVKIRYELVGDAYESTLIDGELDGDAAEKLQRRDVFPLDENFLPTKPLAVGESQFLDDRRRLGWAIKAEGAPVRFVEGPKITLEKVEAVDGVKTAFLTLAFRSTADDPARPDKPETAQARATILYDLDRGYVIRVDVRATFRGNGEVNNTKGTVTAEVVSVSRTAKK